jgi:LL-diaminopimelate aminotransferase
MLRAAGFSVETPPAAIYIWARLPVRYNDSMDFCSRLLDATGVSITPGPVYGDYGDCYVRVSLCTPNPLIHEAMQRMQDWMKNS